LLREKLLGTRHNKRRAKKKLIKMERVAEAKQAAGVSGHWAPVSRQRKKVQKWNFVKRKTAECEQCQDTFPKTKLKPYNDPYNKRVKTEGKNLMCDPCFKDNEEHEQYIEKMNEAAHPDDRGIPEDFMNLGPDPVYPDDSPEDRAVQERGYEDTQQYDREYAYELDDDEKGK